MVWLSAAQAASSFDHTAPMLNARLITAEDGVTPQAGTLSAGLVLDMQEGWHSYWKAPGSVGYPPSIDWTASENVKSVEIMWPAPKRFVAFDIENYGYEGTVTHPLKVTLERPGEPVKLRGAVSILVCAELCVPLEFDLAVGIGAGQGIDTGSAALIADASNKVPLASGPLRATSVALTEAQDALVIDIVGDTSLSAPMAFVDMGGEAAFGAPRVTVSGKNASITLPVLSLPDEVPTPEVTLVDGAAMGVSVVALGDVARAPVSGLLWTLVLAFVGGVILNVMPCVLPVLSIKFASALKSVDQSRARIRAGFLVSALGVLAFMWLLAGALIALRATGGQVGWGVQFQSPCFYRSCCLS